MNLVKFTAQTKISDMDSQIIPHSNAVISNNERSLFEIKESKKNIAIYERSTEHLKLEAERLVNESVKIKVSGSIDQLCYLTQKELFKYLGCNSCLNKDIIDLIFLFQQITKASSYSLFLSAVHSNMCRKFHTDMNDLRLLCTYVGPGTMWLTDNNVNRNVLHEMRPEPIAIEKDKIEQVQTGAVAVLKGAIYPQKNTNAVVHRSPAIEETSEKRLLLRIDTNDFLGSILDETN